MVRRGLVGQADQVGQLLNAGLAGVQRLKQSDSVWLGHDPKTLCSQFDYVFGK